MDIHDALRSSIGGKSPTHLFVCKGCLGLYPRESDAKDHITSFHKIDQADVVVNLVEIVTGWRDSQGNWEGQWRNAPLRVKLA